MAGRVGACAGPGTSRWPCWPSPSSVPASIGWRPRPRGTSRGVVRVNVFYLITLPGVTTYLAVTGHPWLLAAAAAGLWAAILTFHTLVPERCYLQTPVKSDVPRRWTMILRMTYLT